MHTPRIARKRQPRNPDAELGSPERDAAVMAALNALFAFDSETRDTSPAETAPPRRRKKGGKSR
jgi:hypothetical protein